MKFISLFAGAGGLDLGLERAGMECVAQVEIDETCRAILTRHWPDVPKFNDVKEYHPDPDSGVDAVVAGFPCQDISVAGYHAGLAGARSGLVWEVLRIAGEARASWLVLENVAALLTSHGGRDFGEILEALASRGFDAEWSTVTACSVGAPHMRRRLFIVANSDGVHGPLGLAGWPVDGPASAVRGEDDSEHAQRPSNPWADGPYLSDRMANGSPRGLVRAGGNAVVPQVAEAVGRRVMGYMRG